MTTSAHRHFEDGLAQGCLPSVRLHYEETIARLEAARSESRDDVRRALSDCHKRLGNVLREQGDLLAASVEYGIALRLAQELVACAPASTEAQLTLSICHERLGTAFRHRHRDRSARRHYEVAHDIASKLVAENAGDRDAQLNLGITHRCLGDVLAPWEHADPSVDTNFDSLGDGVDDLTALTAESVTDQARDTAHAAVWP